MIQGLLLGAIAVTGPAGPQLSLGVPARAVGVGLVVLGLAFALRGVVDLRENITALPRPRPGATLVTWGAYRLVRHPIYTGLLAASCGWSIAWSSVSAVLVSLVLGVFFDLKARREEAWLRCELDGYAAYCARTRRLVPWIY